MLEALADGGGGNAIQMVDSTVIRAHRCASGVKGDSKPSFGRSRGGFSIKIHARTNAQGLPIALLLTPGDANDSTAFNDLMAEYDADPAVMLSDKGYDSDAIRDEIDARGGAPEIPTRKNRRVQHAD